MGGGGVGFLRGTPTVLPFINLQLDIPLGPLRIHVVMHGIFWRQRRSALTSALGFETRHLQTVDSQHMSKYGLHFVSLVQSLWQVWRVDN
jgi:hypothetical protein